MLETIGGNHKGMQAILKKPDHFEFVEDRAVFRPAGQFSLSETVSLVANAIAYARQENVRRFLINVSGLTGFPSPSLPERYFFIREWAAAAGENLNIAMVSRPEFIDPQKFGVTVAANAGLCCDVFATEAEALSWLQNLKIS